MSNLFDGIVADSTSPPRESPVGFVLRRLAPLAPWNPLAQQLGRTIEQAGADIGQRLGNFFEDLIPVPQPTINPPGVTPRVVRPSDFSIYAREILPSIAETIPTEAAKFVTPNALAMQIATGGAIRGLAGTRLGQFPVETIPGLGFLRRFGAPQIFEPLTKPKGHNLFEDIVPEKIQEAQLVEPPKALPSPETVGPAVTPRPLTPPIAGSMVAEGGAPSYGQQQIAVRGKPPLVRSQTALSTEALAQTHPGVSSPPRNAYAPEVPVVPITRAEADLLNNQSVELRPGLLSPKVFREVPPEASEAATGLQYWYKYDLPASSGQRYPRITPTPSEALEVREPTHQGVVSQPLVRVRQQAIQAVARELREQATLFGAAHRDLSQRIMQSGGIKPTLAGGMREELQAIRPYLRQQGQPIDTLATELGFEDGEALRQALIAGHGAKMPRLAEIQRQATQIVDSEPGGRILQALQSKGATGKAITSVVRDVTKQMRQQLAAGQREVRGILTTAQQKAMTPAQLARVARAQRVEPGATELGPRGGEREAPLSPADIRRVEASTQGVVSPPPGQPTGTPPVIPRSRALVPANVPRPVRDLNQFQSTPLSGLDPSRAAQLIDNVPHGPTERHVLTPLRTKELVFRQEQQRTLGQLRQISGNLKEGSPESQQVFRYLEGKASLDQLSPRAKQTAQWMASQFDDLLGRVNQARESVGKRPILRREGYITHIKSPSLWEAMREAFTNAPDEATKNLQTAFFEQLAARGPGFRFGLPRRGGPFEEDALRAFKAYLPAALRVIHLSEPSRLATVYVNQSLSGTPNASRYFSQLVRQVATGEQGPFAKLFPQTLVRASNWLKGRFGKGTILGNLSSVLQQPFTLPATVAQNGPEASTAAAAWIARGDGTAFAMQWSPTLQARVMEMDVDFTHLSSKWDAAMGSMFAAADRTMVAHAFNSGYLAAVKNGATFPQAIEAGEQSALRTQSSFLTSDMAPVFRDAIGSGFLQFQNTINGVFNFLKFDVPRRQNPLWAAGAFVGTFVAMNAIYEALGLPHPDQISDFIPGLSTTRSGGPVGIKLLVALSNLGSQDERKRQEAARILGTSLPAIVFGAGGNQIRKSFSGLQAVGAGGKFDARGRMQFPVQGLAESARSVAFGPYQTKAGRAYIQRGFKPVPMTEEQKRVNRAMSAFRRRMRP